MPNRMPIDLKQHLQRKNSSDKSDKSDISAEVGPNRTESDRIGRNRTESDKLQHSNLRGLVRAFVLESPGTFSIYDVDRELGLTTRQDKKNRSDALADLVCEGFIERDLNRRGVFRKKDNTLVEMDILGAKSEELPVELPFGLSKYIEINNKEIILFMGESNSGKTTVIFNMIWSCLKVLKAEGAIREKCQPCNNGCYGIRYFSSEMGPTGVRKKLQAFGPDYPITEWVKYVSSVERNRDFQDVVDPYGLNFIDYLEVFDGEYFKLSSSITAIFSALQTGIAVIALQKKSGTDIGRGGEATLEKPRLALALSENKERGFATVKIVKAKHYRDMNPVGMELDFIIRRKGTRIIEVSQWGYARDHQVRRNSMNYHEFDRG